MDVCYPTGTDWSTFGDEDAIEGLEDYLKDRAEMLAWHTLAALTAYRIGVCPTTVRPCAAGCSSPGSWLASSVSGGGQGGSALPIYTIGSFTPYVTGGQWVNGCGCRGDDCMCTVLSEVILPGPVGAIVEVRIDGQVVDDTLYRVDNGNRLVSLSPAMKWPVCQSAVADNAVGSFMVTYYRGAAPSDLSRLAAGILAVEYYKLLKGDKCKLPQRATSVSRGGSTIELEIDSFENGRTGLRIVDDFIGMLNPNHLKVAPMVYSPDTRGTARRTTWQSFV